MIFINQELILLLLLANLITISVAFVGAANSSSSANSTCNRSCGERKLAPHVSYPVRFSEDCEIGLTCTAKSGRIHLAGFEIKNLTSDSILLHFPANCTLKVTEIIATFLPAESYSSYDSTQEALRSLLHSVIKMPTVKNMVVELNDVLVTHALVTIRELLTKCAQHYSWYSTPAIHIAKGSTLLPLSLASVFDDLASSSLDVFFDPSNNLLNIRGLTVGSFKLISRCIKDKGQGLSGTKRYFGDLGKILKMAGSNILFAAVTEISDSVLKGAESSDFNGMVHDNFPCICMSR